VRRRWRWGVVLGSMALHGLLAALFLLDLRRAPIAGSPPAMTVFLERDPTLPKPRSAPDSRSASKALSPARPDAAPILPIATPPGPPSPPSQEGSDLAGTPAPDLRGLGGCRLSTLDRLPAEERARCQERLAEAMQRKSATRPNLDPSGRFAKDVRPYLTRNPENGCKPVGSIKPGLMGSTDATLGLGCAKAF